MVVNQAIVFVMRVSHFNKETTKVEEGRDGGGEWRRWI